MTEDEVIDAYNRQWQAQVARGAPLRAKIQAEREQAYNERQQAEAAEREAQAIEDAEMEKRRQESFRRAEEAGRAERERRKAMPPRSDPLAYLPPQIVDFCQHWLNPKLKVHTDLQPWDFLQRDADKIEKWYLVDRIINSLDIDQYSHLFVDTPYWKACAAEVHRLDQYVCQHCHGDFFMAQQWLQTHHKDYQRHGREHFYLEDLQTLCATCHALAHSDEDRRRWLPPPVRTHGRELEAILYEFELRLTVRPGHVFHHPAYDQMALSGRGFWWKRCHLDEYGILQHG
jgi:hypothetical protein